MATTISVPAGVAELAGLFEVDYDEAFTVRTDLDPSPEAWARHCMEGAPSWMRAVMVNGWHSLGIHLAPLDSAEAVLGWPILRNDPDVLVLGIESTLGLTARIVIQPAPDHVMHAMLVRLETPAAHAVWAALAPPHRVFVRRLLDVAASKHVLLTS